MCCCSSASAEPQLGEPERKLCLHGNLKPRDQDGLQGFQRTEDLKDLTKQELEERARELDIAGRSKMDQKQLIKAISQVP